MADTGFCVIPLNLRQTHTSCYFLIYLQFVTFHILNAKYVNSLRDKVRGLQNNESVACEKDFFFQRPLYKKNHFSCYHAKIPDKGILVSLFVLAHSLEVHMSRRHGDYKWWLASHTVSGVKKKKEMSLALLWLFPSPFLSVWDSNFLG